MEDRRTGGGPDLGEGEEGGAPGAESAVIGGRGCPSVTAGLCSSRAWRRTFLCGAASPPRTSAPHPAV